jgi:hypothetical protein
VFVLDLGVAFAAWIAAKRVLLFLPSNNLFFWVLTFAVAGLAVVAVEWLRRRL